MRQLLKKIAIMLFIVLILFFSFKYLIQKNGMRDVEISDNRTIKIINSSDKTIYWLLSDSLYIPIFQGIIDSLSSLNIDTINCFDSSWENVVEYSNEKKICIFILSNDSVIKYGLDSVCLKSKYQKKILVDIDYLEKNNWTIIYR